MHLEAACPIPDKCGFGGCIRIDGPGVMVARIHNRVGKKRMPGQGFTKIAEQAEAIASVLAPAMLTFW